MVRGKHFLDISVSRNLDKSDAGMRKKERYGKITELDDRIYRGQITILNMHVSNDQPNHESNSDTELL